MANPEKPSQEKPAEGTQIVRTEPAEIARPSQSAQPLREPVEMMRELQRWDPFRDVFTRDPFREMRDMMRNLWSAFPEGRERAWSPAFEVRETEDAYIVAGDVPGLAAEDLDVTVAGDRLEISGTRERKEEKSAGEYRAHERAYGSFARTFTIPGDVDVDTISSRLEHGVLELVLPKKPGAKQEKRKIEIKTAAERH